MIEFFGCTDYIGLLKVLQNADTSDNTSKPVEWFQPDQLQPADHLLEGLSQDLSIGELTLKFMVNPIVYFQLYTIIGIEQLDIFKSRQSNLTDHIYTVATALQNQIQPPIVIPIVIPIQQLVQIQPPIEIPIAGPSPILQIPTNVNTPTIYVFGNSRAQILQRADSDHELFVNCKTSATLQILLHNILPTCDIIPNTKNFLFLVDPICSITTLIHSKRSGFRQVIFNNTKQVNDIIQTLKEIKEAVPSNIILIVPTVVGVDLKKANRKHGNTKDIPFMQEKLIIFMKSINEEIVKLNKPYSTPKLHLYNDTYDGTHATTLEAKKMIISLKNFVKEFMHYI